jgi:hypothetical protein
VQGPERAKNSWHTGSIPSLEAAWKLLSIDCLRHQRYSATWSVGYWYHVPRRDQARLAAFNGCARTYVHVVAAGLTYSYILNTSSPHRARYPHMYVYLNWRSQRHQREFVSWHVRGSASVLQLPRVVLRSVFVSDFVCWRSGRITYGMYVRST